MSPQQLKIGQRQINRPLPKLNFKIRKNNYIVNVQMDTLWIVCIELSMIYNRRLENIWRKPYAKKVIQNQNNKKQSLLKLLQTELSNKVTL